MCFSTKVHKINGNLLKNLFLLLIKCKNTAVLLLLHQNTIFDIQLINYLNSLITLHYLIMFFETLHEQ